MLYRALSPAHQLQNSAGDSGLYSATTDRADNAYREHPRLSCGSAASSNNVYLPHETPEWRELRMHSPLKSSKSRRSTVAPFATFPEKRRRG